MQELPAYLPLVKDEDAMRDLLTRYGNLLNKESELAKDVDADAIRSGAISDLKDWLDRDSAKTRPAAAGN
jgi:hypothetical protein